nr:MAG TPA: hypothetical protein [Caudoviricetes sp.]
MRYTYYTVLIVLYVRYLCIIPSCICALYLV